LNNQSKSKITCFVEQWLIDKVKEQLKTSPDLGINIEHLQLFSNKDEELKKKISYMITLGGDGTILYGSKQFTGPYIPLVVSFAMVTIFS